MKRLASLVSHTRESLVARLVGAYLLLSVLTVFLASGVTFLAARTILKDSVFHRLESALTSKEASLNHWIDNLQDDVVFLAEELQEYGLHPAHHSLGQDNGNMPVSRRRDVQGFLDRVAGHMPIIQELSLLAPLGGKVLVSTNPESVGDYRATYNYYIQGRQRTYRQSVYPSPVNLKPAMTIATPIQDSQGGLLGVLAANADLAIIDSIVRDKSGLGRTGQTYLVDQAGVFVSGREYSSKDYLQGVQTHGVDQALQHNTGFGIYRNHEGVEVIGHYRWLDTYHLALLAEMHQSEALAPAVTLAWATVGVGIFCAAALAGGMFWLSLRTARPVKAVAEAASRVAGGDLNARAPVLTTDEVGFLAENFNNMTRELSLLYDNLESRVRDRTLELEAANDVLRKEVAERKRMENLLRNRIETEKLISQTSSGFINLSFEEIPRGIDQTLASLARFAGADRCYVVWFSEDRKRLDVTSEWCAPGTDPVREHLDGYPVDAVHWSLEILVRTGTLFIPDLGSLPDSATEEIQFLDRQGVRSRLWVALLSQNETLGFLGFDLVTSQEPFTEDAMALLKITGEILVNVIRRGRAEASLQEERRLLARRVEERTAELAAANAELSRAVRTKDDFLATMSHELRTPINAILGLCESMRQGQRGEITRRQEEALETIESSAWHLLLLINDILDLSKIEAGKLELDMEPVSADKVCRASLSLVEEASSGKDLSLEYVIHDPDVVINADERRLKQILINLLANAVKFTPHGGRVRLEVSRQAEDSSLVFSVVDNGIGIDLGSEPDLFKPFVQVESGLARSYEGTGLGLALVSRLTRLHFGSVKVQSQPGKGSRFEVELPLNEDSRERIGAKQETARTAPPPGSGLPPLILLAEDHEAFTQAIRDHLMHHGYRVSLASNGVETVERAREEVPDLILMDIQMPKMDGLEATRLIRSDDRLHAIPIVALTALVLAGDKARCLEAGADEYLRKPIRLQNLLATIESLLADRRAPANKARAG